MKYHIPRTKVTADIFTFDNCNYSLVVDYTSKFPIFQKLPSMTQRVVTEMLKSIFLSMTDQLLLSAKVGHATHLNTLQET